MKTAIILVFLLVSLAFCAEEFPKKELCLMGCKLLKQDWQRQLCEMGCQKVSADSFPNHMAGLETASDSEFVAQLMNLLKTKGKRIIEKAKKRLNGSIKTAGINFQLSDAERLTYVWNHSDRLTYVWTHSDAEFLEQVKEFSQKYFGKAARKLQKGLKELGINIPLSEADMSKKEICLLACGMLKGFKKTACKFACQAL